MLPEHFNDVTDHKSRSGLKYIYKYIPIKLEGDPLTLSIMQGTQWNTSNLIGLGKVENSYLSCRTYPDNL